MREESAFPSFLLATNRNFIVGEDLGAGPSPSESGLFEPGVPSSWCLSELGTWKRVKLGVVKQAGKIEEI